MTWTPPVGPGDLLDLLYGLPDLDEVAKWLDDYDRMATNYLDMIARSSDASPELKERALASIPSIFSTEVQDDLRGFAASVRLVLEHAESEPDPDMEIDDVD